MLDTALGIGQSARVSGEKIGFLLFGVGFLILGRVLYIKRRWYARVTTEVMYFNKDSEWRERKAQQTEAMFRVLLGYVFPIFTLLWLLLVAIY